MAAKLKTFLTLCWSSVHDASVCFDKQFRNVWSWFAKFSKQLIFLWKQVKRKLNANHCVEQTTMSLSMSAVTLKSSCLQVESGWAALLYESVQAISPAHFALFKQDFCYCWCVLKDTKTLTAKKFERNGHWSEQTHCKIPPVGILLCLLCKPLKQLQISKCKK